MLKQTFKWIGFLVISIGLILSGVLFYEYRTYPQNPVLEPGETQTLDIPEGAPWPRIVSELRDEDLIESSLYFDYFGRLQKLPREVKSGEYELEGQMTVEQLADKLAEGPTIEEYKVTFPEGVNIFEMADILARTPLTDRETFLSAVHRPQQIRGVDLPSEDIETVEGYLFPETYRFKETATVEDIVRRLHEEWDDVWRPIKRKHLNSYRKLQKKYDFDLHDVVTLASIIQLETSLHSERPVIARVFLNRLDRGMRLQTDPTCVYGPERYKETPSPRLCKRDPNAYSTYAHDGLPPGPIGNPGRESLEAALSPSTSKAAREYLFFVSKGDSKKAHYFSKTYSEHRRAINRYLK